MLIHSWLYYRQACLSDAMRHILKEIKDADEQIQTSLLL